MINRLKDEEQTEEVIMEIEALKEICYYGNNKNFENCTVNETTIQNYAYNHGVTRVGLNNIKELFEEDTFG